jgi:hypothetical protein
MTNAFQYSNYASKSAKSKGAGEDVPIAIFRSPAFYGYVLFLIFATYFAGGYLYVWEFDQVTGSQHLRMMWDGAFIFFVTLGLTSSAFSFHIVGQKKYCLGGLS